MLGAFYDAGVIVALLLLFVISGLLLDWLVRTKRGYGIGEDAPETEDAERTER